MIKALTKRDGMSRPGQHAARGTWWYVKTFTPLLKETNIFLSLCIDLAPGGSWNKLKFQFWMHLPPLRASQRNCVLLDNGRIFHVVFLFLSVEIGYLLSNDIKITAAQ